MDQFRSHICFIAFIQLLTFASTALLPPLNVATVSTLHLSNASHLTLDLPLNVPHSKYPVQDPYDIQPLGSNEVIEFYGYGNHVPRRTTIEVLNNATFSALEHDGDTLIGTEPLQSWVDGLQLMLIPRENMTWRMWTTALWGMRMAVKDKEMFFEWSFAIASTQLADDNHVGYGLLEEVTRGTVTTSKQ